MADSVAAVGMGASRLPSIASASRSPGTENDLRLSGAPTASDPDKSLQAMKEAARQFESYFTYMMLKEMRKSVPKDGILSSGIGHDIYQSMYDEAIAEEMSKTQGLGLSKALVDQYLRTSGGMAGPPPMFKLPEAVSDKGSESLLGSGRR